MLKSNTYGVIKVERRTPKPDGIKVAICPNCGEVSLYLANMNQK